MIPMAYAAPLPEPLVSLGETAVGVPVRLGPETKRRNRLRLVAALRTRKRFEAMPTKVAKRSIDGDTSRVCVTSARRISGAFGHCAILRGTREETLKLYQALAGFRKELGAGRTRTACALSRYVSSRAPSARLQRADGVRNIQAACESRGVSGSQKVEAQDRHWPVRLKGLSAI
jgi:hypothetical protein